MQSISLFGQNGYSLAMMPKRSAKRISTSAQETAMPGRTIAPATADAQASHMRSWAIEKGATHSTYLSCPWKDLKTEKPGRSFKPDGRGGSLTGAPAPKRQRFDGHCFGANPGRELDGMCHPLETATVCQRSSWIL